MKQTVEEALGKENVVIDINQMSSDDLNNITYYASNAAAEDWDISNGVAWESRLRRSIYLSGYF